jgi:hypothetical protein
MAVNQYDLSPCHTDSKCVITLTDTITVTTAYKINVGVQGIGFALEALSGGFSYTYSIANSKSKALGQTASENFCGSWTFLPFY